MTNLIVNMKNIYKFMKIKNITNRNIHPSNDITKNLQNEKYILNQSDQFSKLLKSKSLYGYEEHESFFLSYNFFNLNDNQN